MPNLRNDYLLPIGHITPVYPSQKIFNFKKYLKNKIIAY
jgi:hypothetical protein